VEGGEGDAAGGPAGVLGIVVALAGEGNGLPAEGPVGCEEGAADELQAVQRVGLLGRGVRLPVAVGPLVVAGGIDERVLGRLEPVELFLVDVVGARRASALDVAGRRGVDENLLAAAVMEAKGS
jgi:hypothetical protein